VQSKKILRNLFLVDVMGILHAAGTRIKWNKTEERMKAIGFTKEEINRFREKPTDMFIRFLDEGKEVPLILEGPNLSIDVKLKTLSLYAPLFCEGRKNPKG